MACVGSGAPQRRRIGASVPSRSMVAPPPRSTARRATGNTAITRPTTSPIPSSIPAAWAGPNRSANCTAVVDAGGGHQRQHFPSRIGPAMIQNENKLLTNYPGALGGKTGFRRGPAHLRRRSATRRPPPGGHGDGRGDRAGARREAGRDAAGLGVRAADPGRRRSPGHGGRGGPDGQFVAVRHAAGGPASAGRAASTARSISPRPLVGAVAVLLLATVGVGLFRRTSRRRSP